MGNVLIRFARLNRREKELWLSKRQRWNLLKRDALFAIECHQLEQVLSRPTATASLQNFIRWAESDLADRLGLQQGSVRRKALRAVPKAWRARFRAMMGTQQVPVFMRRSVLRGQPKVGQSVTLPLLLLLLLQSN